jgi:hypothetical protein
MKGDTSRLLGILGHSCPTHRKGKISRFRGLVSAESLFLHSRSADSDGQMGLLKAAQEPLRESKCENDANLTGFCTLNPADNQFDLFDALGRNSLNRPTEARRRHLKTTPLERRA